MSGILILMAYFIPISFPITNLTMHVACFFCEGGDFLCYTLRIIEQQLFEYYIFPEHDLKACKLKTVLMVGILDLNLMTWQDNLLRL